MTSGKKEECLALTEDKDDIVWKHHNYERHYTMHDDWFVKRQLSESELPVDGKGCVIRPLWDRERLVNEYASMVFVKLCTRVPVPDCELYTKDGLLNLAAKRIVGLVRLQDVPAETMPAATAAVHQQVMRFILPQLRVHHRLTIGSVSKSCPTFPPARIYQRDSRKWEQITSDGESFYFCHNDLSPRNIWICPETFKVWCITGWEYAGFFPKRFELKLWDKLDWAAQRAVYNEVLDKDLELFGLKRKDLKDCVPTYA